MGWDVLMADGVMAEGLLARDLRAPKAKHGRRTASLKLGSSLYHWVARDRSSRAPRLTVCLSSLAKTSAAPRGAALRSSKAMLPVMSTSNFLRLPTTCSMVRAFRLTESLISTTSTCPS